MKNFDLKKYLAENKLLKEYDVDYFEVYNDGENVDIKFDSRGKAQRFIDGMMDNYKKEEEERYERYAEMFKDNPEDMLYDPNPVPKYTIGYDSESYSMEEGKILKESFVKLSDKQKTKVKDAAKRGEAPEDVIDSDFGGDDKYLQSVTVLMGKLTEGKILEGVWKIGNPDDIRNFIERVNTLQKDYWDVVGSDAVMNGLDEALKEAKILLDIKMGRVQSEEFDIEEGENNIDETYSEDAPEWWKDLWKELDESKAKKCKCGKGETCKCNNIKEDSFGGAGTDKRSGQVIGDIIQLIRSTGIDPSDVMEEVGQEFGVAFEFGRG